MELTNFLLKTKVFLIRRVAELFGIFVVAGSILIFISILSYSPSDPNFIVNSDISIKNLLGFKGSVVSDFFIPIYRINFLFGSNYSFFSGTNILFNKKYIILIDNLFFCILYILFGCLYLSFFYNQSFFLAVNGSGGFVGLFLKNSFLTSIIELNQNISNYVLVIFISFLFLVSINFKILKNIIFYCLYI